MKKLKLFLVGFLLTTVYVLSYAAPQQNGIDVIFITNFPKFGQLNYVYSTDTQVGKGSLNTEGHAVIEHISGDYLNITEVQRITPLGQHSFNITLSCKIIDLKKYKNLGLPPRISLVTNEFFATTVACEVS